MKKPPTSQLTISLRPGWLLAAFLRRLISSSNSQALVDPVAFQVLANLSSGTRAISFPIAFVATR